MCEHPDTVAARASVLDRIRIREAIEDLTSRPEAHLLPLLHPRKPPLLLRAKPLLPLLRLRPKRLL